MVNWGMIGAMVLPNVGGWAGSFVTLPNIPTWYEKLNKPNWRPPNWAFGPVWTSLYTSMGYASYLVYKDGGGFDGIANKALMLYGTQLALNWAWTPIFFGMKRKGTALIEILMLDAAVGMTAKAFYDINPTAGLIMVPYMAWLALATTLSYCIWRDNPDSEDNKDD